MPRDKVTNTHQGYAFVEFDTPENAEYAIRIMNNHKLYGKMLRVNKVC
jgi:splicing factor 3B subunit 4